MSTPHPVSSSPSVRQPTDSVVRIELCREENVVAVTQLADEALGVGYLDMRMFRLDHCLVALSAQQVVGFICTQCTDCQASLQTVVVHPAFRGQGIARLLGLEALSRFSTCVSWTSPAWEHNGKVPADKLLRALGFEPVFRAEDYWYADSVRRGYDCPVCGNPCHCSAVIYGRPSF